MAIPSQKVKDVLPPFYRDFLPDFVEALVPVETLATCDDCAMCQKGGEEDPGGIYFSPESKCCTYYPNLPNYLVGALLSDPDPQLEEGRRRVREKIKERIGVMPQGVQTPRKYTLLYQMTKDGFGRSQSLLCPFYDQDQGNCTVWRYRESACTTFFCKFVIGADSSEFWRALHNYLVLVQRTLVQFTLHELGFPAPVALEPMPTHLSGPHVQLTIEDVDEVSPSERTYEESWGKWVGREEEVYLQSYRLVSELTREEFEKLVGITSRIQLAQLEQKRRHMMNSALPATLKRNPGLQVSRSGDDYLLVTHSKWQPIRLQRPIYEILDYFDGRQTNEEVLRRIRVEKKAQLEQDLLVHLFHFRILVPPEHQEATTTAGQPVSDPVRQ